MIDSDWSQTLGRRRLPWALLTLAFLLVEPCLYARGRPEDDLARAEDLVKRQQYDEAIRTLADVIRRDPNLFDAAQGLVDRIRHIQNGFNDRYGELLKVLYDERDVEKALKIIAELEALDPNPNKATRDAIAEAKRAALGQANRIRFDRLMDEALAMLGKGDLPEAMRTYLGAFELHREEFVASPLGNVAKDSVSAALDSVRSAAATFFDLSAAFTQDNRALAASVSRGGQDLQRFLALQKGRLDRMAELVATADRAAQTLVRQRQALSGAADAISYFLYYSEKAITGRQGREADEGIERVVTAGMRKSGQEVVGALRQAVDSLRPKAAASFQAGDWRAAREGFAALEPFSLALIEFAYLSDAGKSLPPGYDPAKADTLVLQPDLAGFLEAQHLFREQAAYAALAGAQLDAVPARTATGWDPARLAAPVAAVEAVVFDWNRYMTGLQAASTTLASRGNDVLVAAARALREWREAVYGVLEPPLAALERQTAVDEQAYQEGERVTQPDGTVRTVFRPSENLARFTTLRERAGVLAAQIGGVVQQGLDPARFGPAASTVTASLNAVQGLRSRSDALTERLDKAIADATARAVAGDSYKRQGDNEYRAAQTALGQGQYSQARDSVAKAAEAYDRSLEVQEDPVVRDLRDRALPALLAEINKGENNRVVGEVRRLIEAAIAAYRRTEFKSAEQLLVNAQARWKDANAEPNIEIENWLALVRRALSTQEGWELAETQPRYTEIVQLLKFASDSFAQGEALESQKQTQAALLAFTAAQQKLNTLNVLAPKLKSASFLRLKIMQKLEPADFDRRLSDAMRQARNAANSGNAKALIDSYSDLSDFAQIVTNDRELSAAIERIEILLGRRPAPPDPAKIADSRARYVEAQRIYDARQRDLYGQAVRLLDQAITLYPENRDAALLKDRILIDTGGARQDIISSDDLREFRAAEKLFGENNYPAANDIVKRLLRKPANGNYPPLLDLRDKLARRGFK